MAKWDVQFEVRKGNAVTLLNKTVEADSEYMAVRLAETQLKSSSPSYRTGYDWNLRKISKK